MTIKRYKPYDYETLHDPPLLGHDMAIDEEGEYVLYSDYEALKKRNEVLEAALKPFADWDYPGAFYTPHNLIALIHQAKAALSEGGSQGG